VEYTIPDDEMQRMVDKIGKPIWADWVKEKKAAGFGDAQAIVDTFVQLQKDMTAKQLK
jgi:hypothetical protein